MLLNATLDTDAPAVISRDGRQGLTRNVQASLNPSLRRDGDTVSWDLGETTVRARWLVLTEEKAHAPTQPAPRPPSPAQRASEPDEPRQGKAPGGRGRAKGRSKT